MTVTEQNKTVEELLFERMLEDGTTEEDLKNLEKDIKDSDFCNDEDDLNNNKRGVLTRVQEKMLFNRLKETDCDIEKQSIRSYLVYKNIRLVHSVIKSNSFGFDKRDVFNQGVQGIYESIDRFDIGKGFKYSTYAVWYIKKYIQEFTVNFRYGFKVTGHKLIEISKIKRANEEYLQLHGVLPDNETLFAMTGIAKKTFDSAFSLMNSAFKSLDANLFDGNNGTSMHNYLEGEDLNNIMLEKDSIETVQKVINTKLKPVEKDIFKKLNGFKIHDGMLTLEPIEAGDIRIEYGLEKSEIRKINRSAIEKIRQECLRIQDAELRDGNNDGFDGIYF